MNNRKTTPEHSSTSTLMPIAVDVISFGLRRISYKLDSLAQTMLAIRIEPRVASSR